MVEKRARAFAARADQPEGALFPLPSQLRMFADESARPDGLHYQPDFISAQEEATLIGHIRALPLAPFQFGIYEGKRRVLFFCRPKPVQAMKVPRLAGSEHVYGRDGGGIARAVMIHRRDWRDDRCARPILRVGVMGNSMA